MNPKLSDHAPVILLLVVGAILLADVVNVFVIGGPSFFSLIVKESATTSQDSPSPAGVTMLSPVNVSPAEASASQAIFVPTTATPVPTVSYVIKVTPIQTATDGQALRYVPPTTSPAEVETYALIYAEDLSFLQAETPIAVALDIKEPPLIIDYNVTPVMIQDSKSVTNRSAKKELRTDMVINSTYPSPNAWFTVTVYDRKSGGRLSQDGYGVEYSIVPKKSLVIREAGSYIIQFEGSSSEAHVEMLLKRAGNIG